MGHIEIESGSKLIKNTEAYAEKLKFLNDIAQPICTRKMAKKAYKLIRKTAQRPNMLRYGLKVVPKSIRKGERGMVIIAGDFTPIDAMCHLPAVCEENEIPYVYVPSGVDLSVALGIKRYVMVVLIRKHVDSKELYDELMEDIKKLKRPK